MKEENVHRIRKHAITLAFRDEAQATSWNRYASEFHQSQLLPALNALFDEMAPVHKMVRIDKIEIDLGRIAMPDLMPSLVNALKEKLVVFTKEDIQVNQQFFTPDSLLNQQASGFLEGNYRPDTQNIDTHKILDINETESQKSNKSIVSKKQIVDQDAEQITADIFQLGSINAFIYFLEHGVLPWNSAVATIAELEKVLNNISIPELKWYQSSLRLTLLHQTSCRRLQQQFSFAFRIKILQIAFDEALQDLIFIYEQANSLIAYINKDNQFKRSSHLLSKSMLYYWINENASSDTTRWSETFSAFLVEKILLKKRDSYHSLANVVLNWIKIKSGDAENTLNALHFINAVKQWSASPKFLAASNTGSMKVEKNVLKNIREESNANMRREAPAELPSNTMHFPDLKNALELRDSTVSDENSEAKNELLNCYYLRYAGVILTWAYLPALFEKLGYLHQSQFKTTKTQQRAIHLLGYLASARSRNEEPDLLIAKILCGLDPGAVISGRIRLKDTEKEEAKVMLTNLIANWGILKNTSVAGLQASFFARDGKLMRDANRWKLIVEQKSYDMVLDHLPYPVSLIRLPWMEEMLTVDWM